MGECQYSIKRDGLEGERFSEKAGPDGPSFVKDCGEMLTSELTGINVDKGTDP